MGSVQSFQEFLVTQSNHIPVFDFAINVVLVALYTSVLAMVYVRYGNALSNRRRFAANFVILGLTTMFIISVVKSSLALSLGLVGALSIIRFRTPIKEPEELTYLFIVISFGLALGADQRLISLVAFVATIGIILIRHRLRRTSSLERNMYISITSQKSGAECIDTVLPVLTSHCESINLKRFEHQEGKAELFFLVGIERPEALRDIQKELSAIDSTSIITFVDQDGA